MFLKDFAFRETGGYPGFGLLRHALALTILLHHCYVVALGPTANVGYDKGQIGVVLAGSLSFRQILIEALRPGLFSLVASFFALSGFLVMGSALRTPSLRVFLTFRVLRIVPALTAEVILSALVLGPLVTNLPLGDYFSDPLFYSYFLNILGNVHFLLPGVFTTNPALPLVNANLWTLPYEFYCYLLLSGLMLAGMVRSRHALLVAVIAVLVLIEVLFLSGLITTRRETTSFSGMMIVLAFFVGAAAKLYADAIPRDPRLFLAAAAGYYASTMFACTDALSIVLLTYCICYIGTMRFDWFDRNVRSDYSYGIYLYGYPISQTIVCVLGSYWMTWASSVKIAAVMAGVVPATLLVARISWLLIEKPALRLKPLLLPRRAASPGSVQPPAPAPAGPSLTGSLATP